VLADLAAETLSGRVLTDWAIKRFLAGGLSPVEAAKVKLIVTNLHCKVADQSAILRRVWLRDGISDRTGVYRRPDRAHRGGCCRGDEADYQAGFVW
jgi:hypothetical protein